MKPNPPLSIYELQRVKRLERMKLAVGQVLRNLRMNKKMSQQQLADNSDLERAYVSRLERGISQPTISVVLELSHCLEVDPAEFVSRVNTELQTSELWRQPRRV